MEFPKKFIKASEEFATLKESVPAPYFRRSFQVEKEIASAEIIITGLGYYEAYFNGENITKGFLAPYRSNIDDFVYYDKYDITSAVKNGKNTLGVILGNGIRNSVGAFIWNFDEAPFRGAPITAFRIKLTFKDETESIILSDTETLCAPSPIIFNDLHFGEYYDARLEIKDWNLPDFDDSLWTKALSAEAPRGEAKLCEVEPITVRDVLKPVSITKYNDSYIYDFGVNNAGVCQLKIDGRAGQRILLQHFETFIDGKPYFKNFRFHAEDRYQEDEYYCKGEKGEGFTPRFTYHGFRYVLVSGIDENQATKELLTYKVIATELEIAGKFSCSDEVVNKIQEVTVRSDTSNFHYFPTDCPQREKNGWTADASLSVEQMLLNLTPEKSLKEWLRNIYKAMNDNGQLPGIIPTGGWGYHWGNGPAWDNVIVNLPFYIFKYRGDREVLEDLSTPLMRYLNYLFSRLDKKGLMAIGLGDWCQVGKNEPDFETPLVVTDTILTYDIAEKSAFIFDVLNQEPQKEFALALAKKVKSAFRDNLIDFEKAEVFGKTQTAQAMALYYGLFEETEQDRAFKVLLGYINDENGHFNTGVLGAKVLFRLLTEKGEGDLAYHMITRPDFPSFGNWIARGATTLFEAFYPEGGRVISLNHHFWGDVSAWFYIYLAGIHVNPTNLDVSNVDIKPYFISSLTSVRAYHQTPKGKIAVSYEKTDEEIVLTIDSAKELHGNISLPKNYYFTDGETQKPLLSGKYKIKTV